MCELPDDPVTFAKQWPDFIAHVRAQGPDLVVLPEMPFVGWFGVMPRFKRDVWADGIASHDQWRERLEELGDVVVCGSRPVDSPDGPRNVAFLHTTHGGLDLIHAQAYLPDEEGFWEASWYQPGEPDFAPVTVRGASLGFLVCSELWALDWAIRLGRPGVDALITPRLTGKATRGKWLVAGRAAAIVAGAYSLSSNRADDPDSMRHFGGQGWVIDPDGDVLALTEANNPYVTTDIDLDWARAAKSTYPRYLLSSPM